MTMRIRTDKIGGFLTMALLFMAAMNLGGKFFYYVFLAFFLVFLSKRCLKVDKTTIVYLLLCALMAVSSYGSGLLAVIRRFAPFCFYLVGVNLIANDTDSAADAPRRDVIQRKAYRLLAVVSLGSFSHYLLNYLYNRGAAVGRNTNDIWSGQAMAATGQNALACLMLGLSCAMLFFPMKEWHRWPAAAGIAVMLLYNMTLACRTMLVMLGILLLLGMLYPRQDTGYGTQLARNTIYTALLGGASAIVLALNPFGLRDRIWSSALVSRIVNPSSAMLGNETRAYAKLAFIRSMPQYPLGGFHMKKRYGYAHDLLLDAYDGYGIFVFLLMLAVLAAGIWQLYVLLRRTDYARPIKAAFLLVYCAILLEFAVEPIIEGMPWLFSCYCLINGCLAGMTDAAARGGGAVRNEDIAD